MIVMMMMMMMNFWSILTLLLATIVVGGLAHEIDVKNKASVSRVAGKVAFKMMQFYPGNKTGGIPGLFGDPYYWWESGAVFGSLVDYWAYTGDTSYNPTASEAILHQVGPDKNFMPPNQSQSLGNDDQCFWALTAMSAAEKRFPNPPADLPQWLSLSQAVFNTQAARWDKDSCGGGLRWQIIPLHSGYAYKNTISAGCFFQLGARLARYTGNATYAEWAEKTFDWTYNVGLATQEHRFLDGAMAQKNCSDINRLQWSYNAGMYMAGAAYMYNFTDGAVKWKTRIQGILTGTLEDFFTEPPVGPENIMYEVACEPYLTCNVDQRSFKAYLSRFMALTVKMAPFTRDTIMPVLYTSATSAAKQCSYGEDQNTCGQKWYTNEWDSLTGVGEQISALEVILSTLVESLDPPVTQAKGGTSKGDPAAGGGGRGIRYTGNDGRGGGADGWVNSKGEFVPHTPDKKDRIGSIVLTAAMVLGMLWMSWWMVV